MMYEKVAIVLAFSLLLLMSGCLEEHLRTTGVFDSLLDTINGLVVANTASAPVNPYATPIGVGLSGLVGILEALRRKERSGRKRAEQVINGNNSSS